MGAGFRPVGGAGDALGRWGRAGALGTRWGAGDALGRWGSGQSGALDELVREGEPLPGGELEEIDEHE